MQFWVYNICIYRYIYFVFRNPDIFVIFLKYILYIWYIWYKIYTLCGYIIIYSYRVYIDQKFPAAGGKTLKYMQFWVYIRNQAKKYIPI